MASPNPPPSPSRSPSPSAASERVDYGSPGLVEATSGEVDQGRDTSFQTTYPAVEAFMHELLQDYWRPHELKYSPEDSRRFQTMPAGLRHAATVVLQWFAHADVMVGDNAQFVGSHVDDAAIQATYSWIEAVEKAIHAPTYSELLKNLVGEARHDLGDMQRCVRDKVEVAQCVLREAHRDTGDVGLAVFTGAVIEAVLFQTSFLIIARTRLVNGPQVLADANNLISKDEGKHVRFAALVARSLQVHLPPPVACVVVRRLVAAEKMFIRELLEEPVPGLVGEDLERYAEFIGDYVLELFGYERLWGVTNPFPEMASVALPTVPNFFDRAGSAYVLAPREVVPESAFAGGEEETATTNE